MTINYNICQSIYNKCDLATQDQMRLSSQILNKFLVSTLPLSVYILKLRYNSHYRWVDPKESWSYHFINDLHKVNEKMRMMKELVEDGGYNGNYLVSKLYFNLIEFEYEVFDIELNQIYNCVATYKNENYNLLPYADERRRDIKHKDVYFKKLYMVTVYIDPYLDEIYDGSLNTYDYCPYIGKEILEHHEDKIFLDELIKTREDGYYFSKEAQFLKFFTNHKSNIEYIIKTRFKDEIIGKTMEYCFVELQNNILTGDPWKIKDAIICEGLLPQTKMI